MIDKRLLTDTVIVQKVQKENDFGDLTYSEPLTVKHVRFDRSSSASGANNSKTKDKAGTIFIYPAISGVKVDSSWDEATVSDGANTYIVKSHEPNYLNGKIFSYEVGVI